MRREAALTQEALAVRLGIATKNVQRLESGRQNLTLETLARVALALGVTPSDLVTPTRPTTSRRSREGAGAIPFTRVLGPTPDPRAIPLLTLRAAAGAFGHGDIVETEEWVVPSSRRPPTSGMFVARVDGDSMEPTIPEGSFVLFRGPVLGPLQGRVLLVQLRSASDPETGGQYVVKRVTAVRQTPDARAWVRLTSDNKAHAPMDVETTDGTDLRFIAEVVEVLGVL